MEENIDLRRQTKILVRLQAIDSDKKRIKTMLSAVDEKIGHLDAELEQSRELLEKSENELGALRKEYRDLEAELSLYNPRIEKSKEKLRAVKTNKEYQSLLKEIEELKKSSSSMEDGMLDCLERIEASEASSKRLEADYRVLEDRIEGEKKKVSKESETGIRQLGELEAEWSKVAAELEPEILKTFEKVKGKSRGVTIAPVIGAVCQACNMNIPPQLFNELQRFDTLKFCPSCQRIIYWEDLS